MKGFFVVLRGRLPYSGLRAWRSAFALSEVQSARLLSAPLPKGLTFSGLIENPLVSKKLKS